MKYILPSILLLLVLQINAQNNQKNNKKLSFMEELALKRKKIE